MSILGGLTGRSRGTVAFEGGASCPPPGSIGIVPQKNVLFPELTCLQTLKLWKEIRMRLTSMEKRNLVSPTQGRLNQIMAEKACPTKH